MVSNGFGESHLISSIIASHFRLDPSLPESALRGRVATAPRALDCGRISRHVFGFLNTAAFAGNPWQHDLAVRHPREDRSIVSALGYSVIQGEVATQRVLMGICRVARAVGRRGRVRFDRARSRRLVYDSNSR